MYRSATNDSPVRRENSDEQSPLPTHSRRVGTSARRNGRERVLPSVENPVTVKLDRVDSAIHKQLHTCYETRLIRREEDGDLTDIFSFSDTT